jgi:hypothetical protein
MALVRQAARGPPAVARPGAALASTVTDAAASPRGWHAPPCWPFAGLAHSAGWRQACNHPGASCDRCINRVIHRCARGRQRDSEPSGRPALPGHRQRSRQACQDGARRRGWPVLFGCLQLAYAALVGAQATSRCLACFAARPASAQRPASAPAARG